MYIDTDQKLLLVNSDTPKKIRWFSMIQELGPAILIDVPGFSKRTCLIDNFVGAEYTNSLLRRDFLSHH